MSLKGCFACMKYLVVIFNLLLWLAGIGVLAVAVWLYVDSSVYLNGSPNSNMYFTAIYILMAAGGIMTLVGFLGCCGAIRESQCMLGMYFVLLLVIFAAELTGGVWAYLHKSEMKSYINSHVKALIQEQYGKDSEPLALKTVDAMQRDLKCCGIDGPGDWANHKTFMGISEIGIYTVPRSCCTSQDPTLCDALRKIALVGSLTAQIFSGIHTKGCSQRLQEFVEEHLTVVIGVAIGMAVAQLLALIFSIVLCCGIRDSQGHPYKA